MDQSHVLVYGREREGAEKYAVRTVTQPQDHLGNPHGVVTVICL